MPNHYYWKDDRIINELNVGDLLCFYPHNDGGNLAIVAAVERDYPNVAKGVLDIRYTFMGLEQHNVGHKWHGRHRDVKGDSQIRTVCLG